MRRWNVIAAAWGIVAGFVVLAGLLHAPAATAAPTQADWKAAIDEWNAHYRPLMAEGAVRVGNEPQIMDQAKPTESAIVLIHGITDSPHYMRAVGRRFFEKGYTVLLPLLPGHGLRQPNRMKDVRFAEWMAEVDFALGIARRVGARVSIGGVSVGGVLALQAALTKPAAVDGGVFLFSPALDIGREQLFYRAMTKVVTEASKAPMNRGVGDSAQIPVEGIGANPYRYAYMPYLPASQHAQMTKIMLKRYAKKGPERYADLTQPLFVAWSEADVIAMPAETERLVKAQPDQKRVRAFVLKKDAAVGHASVVLAEDIAVQSGSKTHVLEKKNPRFEEMVAEALAFTAEPAAKK